MNNDVETDDYGPLAGLLGRWSGDKGEDISPEPDGQEENPYSETIVFTPVGPVSNAETQELMAVHYHQIVHRTTDHKAIHNETGYWMWDRNNDVVMHSLAIPRGTCVVAGGKATIADGTVTFDVEAGVENPDWGIIQSPFMKGQAQTTAYQQHVVLTANDLTYRQLISLEIYGKKFDHTDESILYRLE